MVVKISDSEKPNETMTVPLLFAHNEGKRIIIL
jgi:hypothetical protein